MSPVISADVSEDVRDQVDGAREEGESRSAAVRRLLRAGLDAENSDQLHPISLALAFLATVIFFGSPEVTVSLDLAGVPTYAVGLLLFGLAALLNRKTVRDTLTRQYKRISAD